MIALAVIAAFVAIALGLGLAARRGRTMSLEQWTVGGRGFGSLFVFLLMAGEIYTTFTFLGGSGWAYGRGAPAFYILAYGALAYTISYFLLPAIWRHGTRLQLHTQADFFARRYQAPWLGVLVALVGVAAIVPYLVLQLKGLELIVSETSYGRIAPHPAVWIGVAVLVVYVVVSGVRGSAWTAVLKDVMILGVAVALGIDLPLRHAGGFAAMFQSIARTHPGFFTLPAHGMSPAWFVSTVLVSGLGFYMWPHGFASTYTARSADVFRRNAVVMPLYQLVLLFVFFVGFAALIKVPGLKGADTDLSLLRLARLSYGPATVGLIGAAGVLTALVPGSMLLLTAGTILAKNVVRPFAPSLSEQAVSAIARGAVPAIALLAVVFTLAGGTAIVPLLLLGYNVVTQLLPALLACLPEQPLATPAGACAGILVGETIVTTATVSGLTLAKLFPHAPAAFVDLNIGLVALVANALTLLVVSAATRRSPRAGRRAAPDAEPVLTGSATS